MSEDDLLAGLLEEAEEPKEKPKKEVTKEPPKAEVPLPEIPEPGKPSTTIEEGQKILTPTETPKIQVPVPQKPSQGKISRPLPVEKVEHPPLVGPGVEQIQPKVEVSVNTVPAPVEEVLEELEEEEPPNKLVLLIVGDKGTGKTVTALSFPGEICVLSFDRKAMPIKQFFYKGDKRIHVFDIVKHVDWRPERITETSAKAFEVIDQVFKKCAKMGTDWIVVDGTEILEQLAEMYMRHRHGLGPIEGIRNLNIWKERKWILRDVHNKALTAAKKGVIYTVYPTWSERIVAGEVVDRRQEPRWLEFILFETDIVLWTKYDEAMKRFLVEVQSSKLDTILPTGHVYDVTGKPLGLQVNWKQLWPEEGD